MRVADASTQIGIHSILSFTHEPYGRATSISQLTGGFSWSSNAAPPAVPDTYYNPDVPHTPAHNASERANATILMLARNSDVEGAVRSVRELEDRFNRKFGYPWVFLNEEDFDDNFKRYVESLMTGY